MSQIFGPPLITNGLVAYYDIYNPACYVSGSSTLYDLSGNNNHATLVGNPEYIVKSSSYNNTPVKLLGFNGTNQYITMSNALSNVKTQVFWLNMASPYNLSVTERFGENLYIVDKDLESFNTLVLTDYNISSNYISDPEFDFGVESWIVFDKENGDFTSYNDLDVTYPGSGAIKGSLEFTINTTVGQNCIYHPIPSDGAYSYVVSFWYKTSGFTEGLKVYLTDDPANIGISPKTVTQLELSTNWRKVTVLIDTGYEYGSEYLCIGKVDDIGTGVFSFDGVSAYPVDYFFINNVAQPELYQHIASTTDYGFTLRYLMGSENANGLFYTGSFSQIMLYDRKLSEDELKRNAFAFRSRYKTY